MNRKYLIATIIIIIVTYFVFGFYSHLERTKNLESEIIHLQKESSQLKQESSLLKEELKKETNARQKTNEDSKSIMGSRNDDLEKKVDRVISNNRNELNSLFEEIKTKMKELDRKVNDLDLSSIKRNFTRTGDSECYTNEKAVIVTSRWMQDGGWVYDTDWMKDAGIPIVTYYRSKTETEYKDKNYRFPYDSEGLLINKARDALCYLTYVVDCYHSLPENVAFIHGHNYSWHAETNVVKLLKHLKWGEKGFYNLNYDTNGEISLFQGYNDNIQECEDYYKENKVARSNACVSLNGGWSRIGPHWKTLVENHGLGSIPKFVTFASCAQFVVRKDFILKNTLEYYQWLQHWVLDVPIPQHEVSIILEHFFHFIFTHQGMMDFTRVKDIVKDSFYTDESLKTFEKIRKE